MSWRAATAAACLLPVRRRPAVAADRAAAGGLPGAERAEQDLCRGALQRRHAVLPGRPVQRARQRVRLVLNGGPILPGAAASATSGQIRDRCLCCAGDVPRSGFGIEDGHIRLALPMTAAMLMHVVLLAFLVTSINAPVMLAKSPQAFTVVIAEERVSGVRTEADMTGGTQTALAADVTKSPPTPSGIPQAAGSTAAPQHPAEQVQEPPHAPIPTVPDVVPAWPKSLTTVGTAVAAPSAPLQLRAPQPNPPKRGSIIRPVPAAIVRRSGVAPGRNPGVGNIGGEAILPGDVPTTAPVLPPPSPPAGTSPRWRGLLGAWLREHRSYLRVRASVVKQVPCIWDSTWRKTGACWT